MLLLYLLEEKFEFLIFTFSSLNTALTILNSIYLLQLRICNSNIQKNENYLAPTEQLTYLVSVKQSDIN